MMIEITSILDVEKYIEDVDAVIFDLDDTLYSEKEYVRSGYRKIAEHFKRPEMELEMQAIFEQGGKAIDVVFEKYGMNEQKAEALRIYRYQKPDIHLYKGVAEMIERIKSVKKVGIITDGRSEGQRAKMKALRLDVDEVIITDELGGIQFRKPNGIAFRLISKRLDVPLKKMVYVGDNARKDFIAPMKLGMKSIWYRNSDGLYG